MGRSPCCDKMGLKKGPWAPEEDQILVEYIQRNGHGNWRALPKQAGLLRCGKSCRLRWTNYLRPDIKRGNFSQEEKETVIKLHKILGNRWSAIAARLPGRTDNEIKNVWHTRLKNRLNDDIAYSGSPQSASSSCLTDSSTSTAEISTAGMKGGDPLGEINQISWSDQVLSSEQEGKTVDQFGTNMAHAHHHDHYFIETPRPVESEQLISNPRRPYNDDDMDFWFHLYVNAGELSNLPAF